jgi:histidyl-tRNA synthetase
MPAIIYEVLSGLEIPKFQIRISNRKILIGLLEGLGISNIEEVTRIIDKLEKIGEDEAKALLIEHGVSAEQVTNIFDLVHTKDISSITATNETMQQGLDELSFVMQQLAHIPDDAIIADLSIVRGLDYYTGTVYETVFVDDPSYGSICSGGRYDDLASSYINKKLTGVGISIGFSRLFAKLAPQLEVKRISPADVLVILNSEEDRGLASETAKDLRSRGLNVELYHAPQKFSKQMGYAEKKGIPFVWMPPFRDTLVHEVKNMASGEQTEADPKEWKPDA